MKWFVCVGVFLAATVPATAEEPVTFTKDVAPIMFKHCAGCHRPGEVGPFPLLAYKDAAKRADFLKEVTASRRMPPWKAEPGPHKFLDERRLSDAELATLAKWADTGAKEGDPKDLPVEPKFVAGWQLGKPDLVLKMAKPFTVPAGGGDVYRCFALPMNLAEDKTVAAVEFRAGNAKVTHHCLMYLDDAGQGRKKDADGLGYKSFGGPGIVPSGGLGGWAPGSTPRFLPDGTGMYVRKGSDLILQMHYHPSGKEEHDQSQVGIYFTKTPAETIVAGIAILNRRFTIPAGAKRHEMTAESEPMPVAVKLVALAPHMHLLGREMEVTAHPPGGKPVPLVHIKDWDFNWQGGYQYATPVALPKGTVVKLRAVFDNSADNAQNPNTPPKPVRWGEQTTDEMCLLGLRLTTDTKADLRQIAKLRGARLGAGLMGGIPRD